MQRIIRTRVDRSRTFTIALCALFTFVPHQLSAANNSQPIVNERQPDGDASIKINGELKQWHKITLSLDGPFAHEQDNEPNPFTDYRLTVQFTHESGSPSYRVPGYFAADGNAGESSAESGTIWRAHLSPDKAGKWNYGVNFVTGKHSAIDREATVQPVSLGHGTTDSFVIAASDKTGRDFRSKGRLNYVGKRYLQFAGSGEFFLKAGPDAPETLLAYRDFDGTFANKKDVPLKSWQPHVLDWKDGDPIWKDGKGKGLIGALNYLASQEVNCFSFLPYNAGGDGDNVWPFVDRDDKLHYDCSKLDQWGVVFDHATNNGLYLHFKLQENEMDDDRRGHDRRDVQVRESLDGGKLGPERKLYCRELIARFAHELAINWNMGEENTQSTAELQDMASYLHETDPYDHHIVVHTFPDQQDNVYTPLLGDKSDLTGASLQNSWSVSHQRTLKWIRASESANKPWVITNDEQNPASHGVPADPGFEGQPRDVGPEGQQPYNIDDIRKQTLWGTLMAGGAGVEYYFGYQLPQNDLICEDFRSRETSWNYCAAALKIFHHERIPFWQMTNADELVGNVTNDNSSYCLAQVGEIYLVYQPTAKLTTHLAVPSGTYSANCIDPRDGSQIGDSNEHANVQQIDLQNHHDGDVLFVVRRKTDHG